MAADMPRNTAVGSARLLQESPRPSEDVSVVLLTKNAGAHFREVLDVVCRQVLDRPYEVVIVDSTSSDTTTAIAKEFPVTVYQIPALDFGHGKTRNLGARLANGEIIVFLTQDAIPCGNYWLREHLRRLAGERVAGVFGRQLPHPRSRPTDDFSYSRDYPAHDALINSENADQYSVVFSDVNSAIRKSLLLRFPFPDDIIVSEDVYWASKVMSEGFSIAYSSRAAVVHSHSYSLATVFQLSFDQGVGHTQCHALTSPIGSRSFKRLQEKLLYLISKHALRWIPYAIVVDALRFVALWLGMHHRFLPVSVKLRIGKLHSFWSSHGS